MSRRDEYIEYLAGPSWRWKREQAFALHGRFCRRCGTRRTLHVHHVTYARLFDEDVARDLEILCELCHAAVHRGLGDRSGA